MNIKSLRRNYDNLTMLERLSLADNAVARDDENEIRAIVAASPRQHFSQVDYFDLLQEIVKFRFCNLIARLSYVMQFDYFLQFYVEIGNKKALCHAKLAAFSYIRATDSWKSVCEDYGINADFNEQICKLLFSVGIMEEKEEMFRSIAFTEDEARKFLGGEGIKTFEDEKKSIREALGFPEK